MTETTARRRGHGEDAIYFDATKNRYVGAVSLGFRAGGSGPAQGAAVSEREQQREAQAAGTAMSRPALCRTGVPAGGRQVRRGPADAEAGHDKAGRRRGQPDGTDGKTTRRASTPVSARLPSDENAAMAKVGIPPGEAKTVEHAPGGGTVRPAVPWSLHGGQAAERDGKAHRVGQQSGHGTAHLGEQPAEPWPADALTGPEQREVPLPRQPAPSAGHRRGLTPVTNNTRAARALAGRSDGSSTHSG